MKTMITVILLAAYYIFIFALLGVSESEETDDKPKGKQL